MYFDLSEKEEEINKVERELSALSSDDARRKEVFQKYCQLIREYENMVGEMEHLARR